MRQNPDVAVSGEDPYVHYMNQGWREGRDPSASFGTQFYLTLNPDVSQAGVNPFAHYAQQGWMEGRFGSALFDTEYYLEQNPDVAAAGINPLLHYIWTGEQEGRDPNAFFDSDFYAQERPDVVAAGVSPLVHFTQQGWREYSDPSQLFDVDYYLEQNPDVAAAGINPLIHWLYNGVVEQRSPSNKLVVPILADVDMPLREAIQSVNPFAAVHRLVELNQSPVRTSSGGTAPNRFDFDYTDTVVFTEDVAQALPAMSIDGGNSTATDATVKLTLSDALAGALSTGTSNAVTSTYNAGTGEWEATGSIADINILLGSLTYTPSADWDQDLTVTIAVTETGVQPFNGSFTLDATAVDTDAPVVDQGIVDQAVTADQGFTFTVPSDAFKDPDTADSLSYSVQLGGGGALPGWLSFNPATRAFTGSPTGADVGTISVDVIATDGTAQSVTDTFDIVVSNDLQALNLTTNQTFTEDVTRNLTDIVAASAQANITATLTISDVNAGALTTGTSNAVTSTYNAVTGVWQASGAKADVNTLLASVSFVPTANYEQGFTITTQVQDGIDTLNGTITMTAQPVNDAPTVDNALTGQYISQPDALSYTFAANIFSDIDAGDSLTYTATLADGTALPAWLSLDGATRTFSITAGNGVVGSYEIKLIATDSGGATTTTNFQLAVAPNTLYGTAGTDTLTGGATQDIIVGLANNDYLYGKDGDDIFYGNEGQDYIYGSNGNDTLYGGDDRDYLYGDSDGGSNGNDLLYGELGNDNLYGNSGDDTLYGGDNNDSLYGGSENDVIYGEAGNDRLYGEAGNDLLNGGDGDDELNSDDGVDTLIGGSGADKFYYILPSTHSPDANPDIIQDFEQGTDKIWIVGYTAVQAGAPSGTILGYSFDGTHTVLTSVDGFTLKLLGNYTLTAADFQFLSIIGTAGNDNPLTGTNGIDGVLGLDGDDYIDGGRGTDLIWGGEGNDTIDGGASSDQRDTLYGGDGNDVFLMYVDTSVKQFNTTTYAPDIVMDFVKGEDRIDVSRIPITGVVSSSNGSGVRFDQVYTYYDAGNDVTWIRWEMQAHGNRSMGMQLAGNISLDASDFIFGTPIQGTAGDDNLVGTAGDDDIIGLDGNDTIDAGDGHDVVSAESGNNRIFLGGGNDLVHGGGGGDTVIAGDGDDYTQLNGGANLVFFGRGNDATRAGNSTIYGGDGNDNLRHDSGGQMYGERGNDNFNDYSGGTASHMHGGEGDDTLQNRGNDESTMEGGYGADTIQLRNDGGTAREIILYIDPNESTSSERDTIDNNGTNIMFDAGAEATADVIVIYGFTGISEGMGTAVGTTLEYYYDGTYTIVKSSANYSFELRVEGDYTSAGAVPFDIANNFEFRAGTMGTMGSDGALAGTGVGEYIFGLEGADTINAGAGDDNVYGGHDSDVLYGEGDNDYISGGYADDTLVGGAGQDTLDGGSGNDVFDFDALTESTNANPDVIADFKHGDDADKIDLTGLGATGIGAGAGELTIQWNGGLYTEITLNGTSFQINLLGYYESGVDITAADFIF